MRFPIAILTNGPTIQCTVAATAFGKLASSKPLDSIANTAITALFLLLLLLFHALFALGFEHLIERQSLE